MREHRYQPFKDMLDKINYSDLNLELCLFFYIMVLKEGVYYPRIERTKLELL